MNDSVKNIAILGSTGSIGRSALEVIDASAGRLRAAALTAHSSAALLLEQAQRQKPSWIALADETVAAEIAPGELPRGTRLLAGQAGLKQIVQSPDVDIVLSAIVGSAGLQSTWAAVEAGKTIALANKETPIYLQQVIYVVHIKTAVTTTTTIF